MKSYYNIRQLTNITSVQCLYLKIVGMSYRWLFCPEAFQHDFPYLLQLAKITYRCMADWLVGWIIRHWHSSCERGAKLGNGFQIGSRLQQVSGYLCCELLHHKILDNVFVQWRRNNFRCKWCTRAFQLFLALKEFLLVRDNLIIVAYVFTIILSNG